MNHPVPSSPSAPKTSFRAYLAIARFDHWVKNVFVLPGIAIGFSVQIPADWWAFAGRVVAGLLSVGLTASSNYVLNEILDAPFDRCHPVKRHRPVPSGLVSIPWAYAEWLCFMLAGMLLALRISWPFAVTMAALWIMGVVYNAPPIRSKDRPYLDVLSESVNNPLRMSAGWYLACSGTLLPPPASLLMSYWMAGCYFMAIKRYAEYREIGNAQTSAAYRKSFSHYTEDRLLVSLVFYGSFAMLTFGSFIVRYRLELILSYPLVALVMALYLKIAFKPNSAAQAPERLYREPALMASVVACAVLMTVLLFVDIPVLARIFTTANTALSPGR